MTAEEAAIARARAVIACEAAGLQALAEGFDAALPAAVRLVLEARGRLVVTGIGKSGHIGAKLAATFASTGTPSFFLHAAEAAHGDLGMLQPEDVVLALSNSGQSREIDVVAAYAAGNSIPLVAITGRADSRLAAQAQVVLRLPQAEEACPNRLAPTTSAVMMLACGHALAILLMEARSFGHAEFARVHPGGRLGLLLASIRRHVDEWGGDAPSVAPSDPLRTVINTLAAGRKGCVVVIEPEGQALVGVITEGDLRRAMSPDMFERTAAEIMSMHPLSLDASRPMAEAVEIMKTRRVAHVIVTEDDRVVDILHVKDLMQRGYL